MAKTYDYKPGKIMGVDGELYDSPFSGTVKVEIPTYKERLAIIKEMGVDKAEDAGIDSALGLINLVEKRVVSVNLKIGKESITSLDELSYYKEGSDIINDLGKVMISGISLGNR